MGKQYNKSLVCLAVPLPCLLKGGEESEASLELFQGGFGGDGGNPSPWGFGSGTS